MEHIDLNCDLGEGGDYDHLLMELVTSCNIACGGHFGDSETIMKTIQLALKHEVNIGAHPSYPDKGNFGRSAMDMTSDQLKDALYEQINAVKNIATEAGGKLYHVKPHGALYHEVACDVEKANIFIEVVNAIDSNLIVFTPPNSVIKKGKAVKIWNEGFADRTYERDFKLRSREKNNAVIHDKKTVFEQVYAMVRDQEIQLENGAVLTARFDTVCVHSDTENSVEILQYLNQKLGEGNIQIERI